MTELTDKQLKVLEGFLDGKDGGIIPDHFYEDVVYCEMFRDWLLGNDGQAALMDKLEQSAVEGRVSIENTPSLGKERDIGWRRIAARSNGSMLGVGEGKTRQEALINAILDMLGAKVAK